MNSICIYCGSSFGNAPAYRQAALDMGAALARRGLTLIYGGASVGLMGAVADGALDNGGRVIGVMPQALFEKELRHTRLTEFEVVDTMHTRKARMIELADAMIALPGGFGTYEELTEAITWAQLGYHSKPCGVLNLHGFYDGLLQLMERAISDGFVREGHRELLLIDTDIERLLDRVATHVPPSLIKWV